MNMAHSLPKIYDLLREVIIPIGNRHDHPLGPISLHNYLMQFETPFDRDEVWSGPGYIEDHSFRNEGSTEIQKMRIKLLSDFPLTPNHKHNNLPIIYAWFLTNLDNDFRLKAKGSLAKWALNIGLDELINLLNLSFETNDPQMKEDLIAILNEVGKIIIPDNNQHAKIISNWIIKNCYIENKPRFDSVSIRSNTIDMLKLCSEYCPIDNLLEKTSIPFSPKDDLIDLDIEYLDGESKFPLGHDLKWYVIEKGYRDFLVGTETQLNSLEKFFQPYSYKYNRIINHSNFPEAAIIQKIKKWGWKEKNGQSYVTQASHGSRSNLQTIIEKYMWCAVHELYSFLSDRLPKIGTSSNEIYDYKIDFNFSEVNESISNNAIREIPFEYGPIFNLDFLSPFPILQHDENDKAKVKHWVSGETEIDWKELITSKPILKNTSLSIEDLSDSIVTYAILSDLDITGKGRIQLSLSACGINNQQKQLFLDKDVTFENYEIDSVNDIAVSLSTYYNIHPRDVYNDNSIKFIYPNIITKVDRHRVELKKLNISFSNYSINTGDVEYYVPLKKIFKTEKGITTDGNSVLDRNKRYLSFYNKHSSNYTVFQRTLHLDRHILKKFMNSENLDLIWFASVYKETNPHVMNNDYSIYSRYRRLYIIWIENNEFQHKLISVDDYKSNQE